MSYDILLFDLDGTLLDFDKSEAEAMKILFKNRGMVLTDEIKNIYAAVNNDLWRKYEKGIISMNQLLDTRFSKTLEAVGVIIDGASWESEYRYLLGECAFLIDGAFDVVKKLSSNHRLFAVTNGVGDTQINRLKLAGMYDFFENIFVSQLIGSQKPSKAFFDIVADSIDGYNADNTIIIGDSLSSDIQGGINAGIDTCYYNPCNKPKNDIKCTYEISRLEELYDICK